MVVHEEELHDPVPRLASRHRFRRRDDYARVRAALLTSRANVVLDTDLPGREHLETTLADARDVAGQMGRCTPT